LLAFTLDMMNLKHGQFVSKPKIVTSERTKPARIESGRKCLSTVSDDKVSIGVSSRRSDVGGNAHVKDGGAYFCCRLTFIKNRGDFVNGIPS